MKKILILFIIILCSAWSMAETVTINTNNVVIGNKKVEKGGTLELGKNVKLDKVIIGDVKNGEKRFFVVKENGKEVLKTKAAIKEDATISITLRPGQKYQFEWKGSLAFSTVAGKQTAEEIAEEKAEKKKEEAKAEAEEKQEEVADNSAQQASEEPKSEEAQLVDVLEEDTNADIEDEEEAEGESNGGTSTGIIVWLVILTILVVIQTGLVWLFTKTVNKAINDERLAEAIVRIRALEKKIEEAPARNAAVAQTAPTPAAPVSTPSAESTPKKTNWAASTPGKELRNQNEAQMDDLFSQIDNLQKTFTISPDDTPAEEK